MLNRRHIQMGLKLLKHTRFNKDFIRYVCNHYQWLRLDKEKELTTPYPTGLMLELGNRCNLHCIICPREYVYGKQMDQGFMPLDKAKAIIDEVYPYLDSIGLTGLGETFLYPHLAEIVQYIKQKRKSIQITVSTNANFVGFTDKIIPLLPYLDSVQFSVDGIGKVYETVRPNTDFNFIQDNIQAVVAAAKDTELMINTVITKENYTDLKNVLHFADQMGIPYVNFNRINLASIPEQRELYTNFFTSEAYQEVVRELNELKKQYPGLTFSGYRIEGTPSFKECTFPWKAHYITWDGYLVPCCAKPFPKEMHFGNVFEEGVMNVLNGEKVQAFRRLWQQNKAPKFCQYCNTLHL
jgi:radical SAM protein with 4Fe4S-binding SPASM domain